MFIIRPSGKRPGFCWPSAIVCEAQRKLAVDRAYGTPTECVTQTTAFCLQVLDPYALNRQHLCAPTIEECEDTRQIAIENPVKETDHISECEPTLNTDPYRLVNHDDPRASPP